ncbi:MAG: CARDB domain-containing protein, partial [bacterium]
TLFYLFLLIVTVTYQNSSAAFVVNEDFESGNFPPANWQANYPWELGFTSANCNGQYSSRYNFRNCNFDNELFQTYNFQPTITGDSLFFDRAYAPYFDGIDDIYDDLLIYKSTNNGATFQLLYFFSGLQLQTAPSTGNDYTPDCSEWLNFGIRLPANTTTLKFVGQENCGNILYLDNIKVGRHDNINDASVEFVWAKGKVPLSFGVPDTISALIKNNGTNPINNLKVYLNVSGTNNLIDSLVILSLAGGDTDEVRFRGFIPVLNGVSNVTVTIPPDDSIGNNTKTTFTQANPDTYRHVDSNCCNSSVGWAGEAAFLSKYRMSNTGQVRKVNAKIPNDPNNIGQIVYGIVLDKDGIIVGKSPHYKIQNADLGTYKTFNITDPSPYLTTNSYFYVGLAQTQVYGQNDYFAPMQMNDEAMARPNANYGCNLGPIGTNIGTFEFPREYGFEWAIEGVAGTRPPIDAGVSDLGLTYDQYFSTTTFSPVGKVFNAGTGPATFTVNRKITPGVYTSTRSVNSLLPGSNANVTFDPWTFISGTTYTIRDSVILAGDGNISNNSMTNIIIPKIAKQLCILWQKTDDKDSLVRSILSDGRYTNNFDTVPLNYTGSYRPWKIIFNTYRNDGNWTSWVRDSLKSFLDNSTPANKKSLVVFSNALALYNDPETSFQSPADSIFYRQYLKAKTISDNWPVTIPASENKFRGIGFFDGITQDSISDPSSPELIKPTNGSSAAFKPRSVTGNNADSCNAVSFAGANYNTFFMTNKFASLRSTNGSPQLLLGPVFVYTKIIDWIQSVNTGIKVLDLTVLLEGFYNPDINLMIRDTVRVYLRNSTNPYAIVDSSKDLLSPSGQASFIFNNAVNGVNYYLQIKHRNALETWSKTPVSFSSNHLNYDFTNSNTKAFGNNMILSGSKYVIYGGDVNQDGSVDLNDNAIIENDAFNFGSGYIFTDVNGDEVVDLNDQAIADNNAFNFVSKITPLSSPQLLAKRGIVLDDIIQQNTKIDQRISTTENKIDNEIYEKYKNEPVTRQTIPDFQINENGKGKRTVSNKNIRK